MADNSQYMKSAPVRKTEQNETWKSIGDLAARIVEKAGQDK